MAAWDLYEGSPSKWMFVVDTDEYAGGLTRELSAYMVGETDEYGESKGAPYRKMYQEDLPDDPFAELVDSIVDDPGDDGIHRSPATLVPTPGFSDDGDGHVTRLEEGEVMAHPAFNSVGIALCRRPTDDELVILTQRALKFATLPPKHEWAARPRILGVRLIEYRTVMTTPWSLLTSWVRDRR